tara:strand:- start:34774 stop:35034 length:261 start_codon:yes stop_codon:yes gene_type:complete
MHQRPAAKAAQESLHACSKRARCGKVVQTGKALVHRQPGLAPEPTQPAPELADEQRLGHRHATLHAACGRLDAVAHPHPSAWITSP